MDDCTGFEHRSLARDRGFESYFLRPWKDGRVDDCTGFENRRGETHRGFKSLSFRLLVPGGYPNGEEPRWKRGAGKLVVGSTPTPSAGLTPYMERSSSGLGRGTFNPVTGVQIPVALLAETKLDVELCTAAPASSNQGLPTRSAQLVDVK